MALPQKYNWLLKENGPLMLKEALKLLDVTEDLSKKNNPIIMSWAKELGADVAHVYIADEIPWCGLFMAITAKRSRKEVVKSPLWALNWGNFGQYAPKPMCLLHNSYKYNKNHLLKSDEICIFKACKEEKNSRQKYSIKFIYRT